MKDGHGLGFVGWIVVGTLLAGVASAQRLRSGEGAPLVEIAWPRQTRGVWYTGDTHEHVQNCDGSVFTPEEILLRMQTEGLNVANVLVWHRPSLPFTQFVCAVTGEPDDRSAAARVLQYGVETSGLDCAKWGHLVGLGIGPEEARIAQGSVAGGACDDMPGLGLGCAGGDGTGALNAPIARHFAGAPGAVTGYAHAGWTLGTYHGLGFDWSAELLASGFTTDARFLDPGQRLSFPDLDDLLEPGVYALVLDHDEGSLRTFTPLLGPVDAALGEAQFFETTYLGLSPPVPTTPPSNWFGLHYKLWSAGLRVAVTGGSDRACPLPGVEHPQTSVALVDGLDYAAWIRGIAQGRTTVGVPRIRVEHIVGGKEIGGQLDLDGPGATADVAVRVVCARAVQDTLQLIVNGAVVRTAPIDVTFGGTVRADFADVPFPASAWVAARLVSQRAHTGATYVIVDGAPVADPVAAEYWMAWCDAVTKRTLERPDLEIFGCQEAEALDRLARARRAFRTLRDAGGLDPAWGVARRGRSSGACRGPITLGVDGPVVAGQPFRLTCVNAPPDAQGVVHVSRAADDPGTCVQGATRLVSTLPPDIVASVPVLSTRSGFAEAVVDAPAAGAAVLHAQVVWDNPPGCTRTGCGGGEAQESASDALELTVH